MKPHRINNQVAYAVWGASCHKAEAKCREQVGLNPYNRADKHINFPIHASVWLQLRPPLNRALLLSTQPAPTEYDELDSEYDEPFWGDNPWI